jgi:hypothetical protein
MPEMGFKIQILWRKTTDRWSGCMGGGLFTNFTIGFLGALGSFAANWKQH